MLTNTLQRNIVSRKYLKFLPSLSLTAVSLSTSILVFSFFFGLVGGIQGIFFSIVPTGFHRIRHFLSFISSSVNLYYLLSPETSSLILTGRHIFKVLRKLSMYKNLYLVGQGLRCLNVLHFRRNTDLTFVLNPLSL